MTTWTLAVRGFTHHWRTHLGIVLGAALGTAILVGALVVGDSVRFSLHSMALARIGKVGVALSSGDRLFRSELAQSLRQKLQEPVAPVLQLTGTAALPDGSARANSIQVLGVDERFFALCEQPVEWKESGAAGLLLNERLAAQLGVHVGDRVVLGVNKPSALSRDAPITSRDSAVAKWQGTVTGIASEANFGHFGLQPHQVPPFNALVPLAALQSLVEEPGRANLLLVEERPGLSAAQAQAALRECWQLADANLELRELPAQQVLELRTRRIFLDPPVAAQALRASADARGVLAYLVNELRKGDRATPYSIVAALDGPPIPAGLKNDEVLVNSWLAEDLGCAAGDEVEIAYFAMGPMRKLEERRRKFKVKEVRPLSGPLDDRALMPDYPGIANAADCRQWESGFSLDLKRIRDKDEEYWDTHRGTPKAFITLSAGQELWQNRFGGLTAIRYPLRAGLKEEIERTLRSELDPESLGLVFQPVRDRALEASGQAQDFGELFLGFSFFLIVSALLLMALLFHFGVERRATEIGTLLALGFAPQRVRRLLLQEGLLLTIAGGVLGLGIGLQYAQFLLHALTTSWKGAVQTSDLRFHAEPVSLLIGGLAGVLLAMLVIWLNVRKQARRPARELLSGGAEEEAGGPAVAKAAHGKRGFWVAACSGLAALALIGSFGASRSEAAAGAFFGAGALLLVAGLSLASCLLVRLANPPSQGRFTLANWSLRNAARRRGRSLAAMAMLACGSFLVAAVGANRKGVEEHPERRSAGTGGFALIGESAVAVGEDLNTPDGRDAYALDSQALDGVSIVPFRLHEGDDASCLNLNRAQTPQLLGVRPQWLAEREAFSFTQVQAGSTKPADAWALLAVEKEEGEEIPAFCDKNTLDWGLHKSVGDLIPMVDERGKRFNLKIAGAIQNSILQGALIISEEAFLSRFPSEGGYRIFLVDAPSDRLETVAATLARALQDVGLELTPTERRLAQYNAVENTYLSTFQALGGLGLLLGSLGLGLMLLRNVLERRSELALLRAAGFKHRVLQGMLFGEHAAILAAGLSCGVVAALVAVLPALRASGGEVPVASLATTLVAVLLAGALCALLAGWLALREPLLNALREREA